MSLCHVQVSSCLWTRCVFVSCAGELLPVTCLAWGPDVSLCLVQVSCCLSPVLFVDQVCLCVMSGELLPVTCLVCGPDVSLCHVQVNHHPSLVWTEIMSFIKGSFAALSQWRGFLDKDSYEKLGRKQAPNFTGSRHKVCVAALLCIHAGTCV